MMKLIQHTQIIQPSRLCGFSYKAETLGFNFSLERKAYEVSDFDYKKDKGINYVKMKANY